jgi:hypothetical protein
LIERQVDLVLAGVSIAALHGQAGGDPPGAQSSDECPAWVAADVDVLLQLIRLAGGAGVVLPHALSGASASAMSTPSGHLSASRAHHENTIEVLGRLGHAREVDPACRDEALRLLQRIRHAADHLDEGHPGASDLPYPSDGSRSHRPADLKGDFLAGQLFG